MARVSVRVPRVRVMAIIIRSHPRVRTVRVSVIMVRVKVPRVTVTIIRN